MMRHIGRLGPSWRPSWAIWGRKTDGRRKSRNGGNYPVTLANPFLGLFLKGILIDLDRVLINLARRAPWAEATGGGGFLALARAGRWTSGVVRFLLPSEWMRAGRAGRDVRTRITEFQPSLVACRGAALARQHRLRTTDTNSTSVLEISCVLQKYTSKSSFCTVFLTTKNHP